MGTRSLTRFVERDLQGDENAIAVMYRQFDGYPSGHGKELAEWLDGFTVVNSYNSDFPIKTANGMGCLAAQAVAYFKGKQNRGDASKGLTGGIYLVGPHNWECDNGQDYTYKVTSVELPPEKDEWGFIIPKYAIEVQCLSDVEDGKVLYSGDVAGFKAFCQPVDDNG